MKQARAANKPNKKTVSTRAMAWVCLFSLVFFLALGFATVSFFLFPTGRGAVVVEIPDYTGQSLSYVFPTEPIELRIEYRYDDTAREGIILSQSPAAGSFCKLSDPSARLPLTLTVSMGRESALLPSLEGREAREAEQELRSLGFLVQTVKKEGAYPAGTVYDMQPAAGARLPLGEVVTLYVSVGAPERSVTVPSLVGLSRSDALVRLWMSGLAVAEVREVASETDEAGFVVEQSHRPGTAVPAGTGIVLYVGKETNE